MLRIAFGSRNLCAQDDGTRWCLSVAAATSLSDACAARELTGLEGVHGNLHSDAKGQLEAILRNRLRGRTSDELSSIYRTRQANAEQTRGELPTTAAWQIPYRDVVHFDGVCTARGG
jgi:hypothetical protein